MSQVTGKDMVDMMAEGIESFIKDHIRDELVARILSEFEAEITSVIDAKLAEMAFKANAHESQYDLRKDLHILIEWSKGTARYKKKYYQQCEMVEE